jgi:dTDP-4-dehydrorhamnose 3,5-epimerase
VIAWNDPDIAVEWPIEAPGLSEKDRNAPLLKEVALENLPRMNE